MVSDSIAQIVRERYAGQFGWVVAWYNRNDPSSYNFGPLSSSFPEWNDSWDADPSMKFFIVKV